MAQPPEAAPLRLQSSLDSAPVQPRVQPNLDALVEQKQHHSPQQQSQQKQPYPPHHSSQQQQQQQLRQQQQQHFHQQQAPETAQLQGAPHISGAQATFTTGGGGSGSGIHALDSTKGECSAGIGDEKTRADGILTANAGSHIHTSVAGPADPVETALGARSDTQQQHNGGAPAQGIPDMSNTQPPPGPARHPVTYASQAAYPPAGMPPVSQYMYSVPSDPYRPNPTTLPSMRTLDHRQPQPQPQHGIPLSAHMASPMTPAPAPAHMGYYGVHPHSHIYGLPDPNAMRFALAPGLVHDPRIALSGGRHKKVPARRHGPQHDVQKKSSG